MHGLPTKGDALAEAARRFDDGTFVGDLARRVAVRTESQEGAFTELRAYLDDELRPTFERLGFSCEISSNPQKGGDFLFAERIEDANLPTIFTYGHGDVVRGMDERWSDGLSPWRLTRRGERFYGRGTADNKGQHSINIAALESVVAVRGRLGFNCKVLIETGEEVGSPGLREFCTLERERLRADALIASDGPRVNAERPTIFLGSRGCFNFDMTVALRDRAHHSGNWGGALANPGIILAHAIASLTTERGAIAVEGWRPPEMSARIRELLRDIELGGGPDEPAIDADWGEPGMTTAEKVYGWNTFEVLAFRTGDPDKPVNAIPGTASAHCQLRFVVGNDPESFLPALRKHLDERGFGAVALRPSREAFFPATRLDPDHPWVRWATDSLERSTRKRVALLPNLGGSLPNDIFAHVLGLPTIWIPHSYPGCSQHAVDEHVPVPLVAEGLQAMTALFWELGESPP